MGVNGSGPACIVALANRPPWSPVEPGRSHAWSCERTKAVVAVARKLAVILYAMWKTGAAFTAEPAGVETAVR